MFNSILREAGLPPEEVCLLRHQDNRADRGRRPYDLWLRKNGSFEAYQSRQALDARKGPLSRPYWASFVGLPDNETLFVGLFTAKRLGVLERDTPMLYRDGIDKAGSCDVYEVKPLDALGDCVGKLFLDWGRGFRSWTQRAELQDKRVIELRKTFKEPDFPGFLNFTKSLSELELR